MEAGNPWEDTFKKIERITQPHDWWKVRMDKWYFQTHRFTKEYLPVTQVITWGELNQNGDGCPEREFGRSKPGIRQKESVGWKQDRRPTEHSARLEEKEGHQGKTDMFDRLEMFQSSFRNWDSDKLWWKLSW